MLLFDRESIQLLKQTIEKDGFLRLPAQGNSMFPLIKENDLCQFTVYDPLQLKRGDIVLFYTGTGQLVAHRFFYRKKMDDFLYFVFKGDTNLGYDQPIQANQLIGKLAKIEKRNTTADVNDIPIVLWKKLILAFPVLSGWLRNYINWRLSVRYRMNKINR